LRIPLGSRKVLIKTTHKASEEKTESGILKVADTEWNEASHADRWGVVVQCPPSIQFNNGMPWKTTKQVSVGMKVWYDYLASLNCITYIDEEGVEYKLISYEDLYVASVKAQPIVVDLQTSEDETEFIIPLNGFHLFETVSHERQGRFDISPQRIDTKYGIVKYVAENNEEYETSSEVDHVELRVGDRVRFGSVPPVMLEDEAHCNFDGGRMYRRSQARNVEMVWRDGELILPQGRVMIKQLPNESITPAGIILPKPNAKNHRGNVVLSSNDEVPVGSEITYIKGAGRTIVHNGDGHRILKESEMLYVK
jgi:co-chaperonin GroES (HSP10)